MTVDYLSGQVEAGVEAVQLFDSWAGSLSPAQFEDWVIAPNAAIVSAFKARHPDVPVIGFPKGAGGKLGAYARGSARTRSGSTRRSIRPGRIASSRPVSPSRAISIRSP
jgi:uroporphyrinogen-III decarboxylase